VKVNLALNGVPELFRALELTNAGTCAETIKAIERGTKAVAAGASARAPRRSGEMAHTIRDEYSSDKMTGYVKVGYGKLMRRSRASSAEARDKHLAKRQSKRLQLALAGSSKQALSVLDLGVYAPVVERGDKRRHKPAHPFTIPALIAERPAIMSDLKNAPIKAAHQAGIP
jgi:hypothetical protein